MTDPEFIARLDAIERALLGLIYQVQLLRHDLKESVDSETTSVVE